MGKSLLLLKRSPWKRKRKRQLNGDTVHTTLTSLSHGNGTSGAITLLLPSKKRSPWRRKRKRQLNGDTVHTTPTSPSAQATTSGAITLLLPSRKRKRQLNGDMDHTTLSRLNTIKLAPALTTTD